MNTQSDPKESQAPNAYDDKSFIKETHGGRVGPNDPTRSPDFPADKARGFNFQPFNVEYRDFHIDQLPQSPLELFQLFVPISLLQKWVEYTNSWVVRCLENGVADGWNTPLEEHSRLLDWEGISAAQIYVWLGMLIYIGIHKEKTIASHWRAPGLGDQHPLHSIMKFMSLRRFQLIHRYLRIFDHTKINEADDADLPKVFQGVEEWSEHIQRMSAALFHPGSHLAVDEGMIRYTGRSNDTAFVKGKPIPRGFKIWVIAQAGFFIHWLWHLKDSQYGAAGITKKKIKGTRQKKQEGKEGEVNDKLIPLNNTQGVVIALCNTLPLATYHVFFDNLFSSADLFRCLRAHGHGATGTARVDSGIYTDLKRDKKRDKGGTCGYTFNEVRTVPTADNKVNQIAWKDNALVLFMTSVFKGDERSQRERKRPSTDHSRARPIQRFFGDEAKKVILIPTVAAAYNDEMNHVDRGDQLRSYTPYDHRLRRGPWQALAWTFLLDVILVNTYLLQLHAPQLNWQRYKNQTQWRECIFNALFNTYHCDSQARKHYRTGDELDQEDLEKRRNHGIRLVNHVNRKVKSDCLACKGHQLGRVRPRSKKTRPLEQVDGNRRKRGGQTVYGCKICKVAICNNQDCWDFYHSPIY